MLKTVPKAAGHQGVVSSTVSPGNQVASWSIQTLPLRERPSGGEPYTCIADRGNSMERNNLNKIMCEKLFGGKLEVTVMPECLEKSNAPDASDPVEMRFQD